MFDALPITLSVQAELAADMPAGKKLVEQLEAWLNFETLKANWFGNETNTLSCVFLLLSEQSFAKTHQQIQPQLELWQVNDESGYMIKQAKNTKKVKAVLKLSDATLEAAKTTPAIIDIELRQLLTKVLNAIAQNNQLDKV